KLAQNQLGANDYLERLRSTSSHKRWQAAYELSGYLARKDVGPERVKFEREVMSIFRSSKPEETLLRKYLLVAMAQVGSENSVPSLTDVVQNNSDPEMKIYAMLALARIGSPGAEPFVAEQLANADAGVRKTAAFAYGFVAKPREADRLIELLNDTVTDVRWNAALGLAQMGNPAGAKELLGLLDEPALRSATQNLRDVERAEIMLSAMNAVGKLKLVSARESISRIARTAVDPRLRTAASNVEQILSGDLLTKARHSE
ncbi:MAG TPA: HEAT repeat domain-containing protein, partial [Bdellovibrionota bacterium]|nr:HEAT repeat domain-containing protein [Bdellovibrionota bacterium]